MEPKGGAFVAEAMPGNSPLHIGRACTHLLAWAQAARRTSPQASHWVHQVIRNGFPYTMTAVIGDYGVINLRLFLGPDLACEVCSIDVAGRLPSSSTRVLRPQACALFYGEPEDLQAPLANESFESF